MLQRKLFSWVIKDFYIKMKNIKEQTLYVRLLEGTETFVPCIGFRKSDLTYEIIENPYLDLDEDATSIWEFFPGDIVRCEKKELDILVAVELIESKMVNRKVYSLLYRIVFSLGELKSSDLVGYEAEYKMLCDGELDIRQKDHPIVAGWIQRNCKKLK